MLLKYLKSGQKKSADQFKIILGNKSVDDFLYTLSQKLNKSWVTESWGKSMDLVEV